MDPALKQAVLGAQDIQTPSSPLGSFPELQALYRSSFQLPQSNAAVGAGAEIAQEQVAAAKRAAAEAKAREEDMKDISKYRFQKNKQGGLEAYAPDGSYVDMATLSERTGAPVPAILAKYGSEDPIDLQFIEDYNNLEKFGSALLSGDSDTVSQYLNNPNPAVKKRLSQYNGRDGYTKLVQDFRKYYQKYYTPGASSSFVEKYPYVPAPTSGSGSDYSQLAAQLQQFSQQ